MIICKDWTIYQHYIPHWGFYKCLTKAARETSKLIQCQEKKQSKEYRRIIHHVQKLINQISVLAHHCSIELVVVSIFGDYTCHSRPQLSSVLKRPSGIRPHERYTKHPCNLQLLAGALPKLRGIWTLFSMLEQLLPILPPPALSGTLRSVSSLKHLIYGLKELFVVHSFNQNVSSVVSRTLSG